MDLRSEEVSEVEEVVTKKAVCTEIVNQRGVGT